MNQRGDIAFDESGERLLLDDSVEYRRNKLKKKDIVIEKCQRDFLSQCKALNSQMRRPGMLTPVRALVFVIGRTGTRNKCLALAKSRLWSLLRLDVMNAPGLHMRTPPLLIFLNDDRCRVTKNGEPMLT